jgi:hypothetical protein
VERLVNEPLVNGGIKRDLAHVRRGIGNPWDAAPPLSGKRIGAAGDATLRATSAGLSCASVDGDGNYSLALPVSRTRLCLFDVGARTSSSCDPCVLEIIQARAIRRDYEAGPGGGRWYTRAGDPASSTCP